MFSILVNCLHTGLPWSSPKVPPCTTKSSSCFSISFRFATINPCCWCISVETGKSLSVFCHSFWVLPFLWQFSCSLNCYIDPQSLISFYSLSICMYAILLDGFDGRLNLLFSNVNWLDDQNASLDSWRLYLVW